MRVPIVPVILALIFAALIDVYIYFALQRLTVRRFWADLQLWSAVVFIAAIVVVVCLPKRSGGNSEFLGMMWVIFGFCSIYISKLTFVLIDLGASIPRIWDGTRIGWLELTGAILALIVFLLMWWGALINRYRIDVNQVSVSVKDLPPSFNGFKIAQISDLHVGTFASDTMFVHDLVTKVNDLHPDVIVFTGDIVNRRSSELRPFVKTLSQLQAPYGVFSVLGNHDYGDYCNWPSEKAKSDNLDMLHHLQDEMGWHMLNNSSVWLRSENDSIALIGVENVGDPPFRTYGDLRQAYPDISDRNIKILLSHNPAHWVADLKDNSSSNIALTLSGHTHAMQFELFGLSPAALRYSTWGGLYKDSKGQNLYVNIGAGEVGFPARIGATPEITLITLTDK